MRTTGIEKNEAKKYIRCCHRPYLVLEPYLTRFNGTSSPARMGTNFISIRLLVLVLELEPPPAASSSSAFDTPSRADMASRHRSMCGSSGAGTK